jgi:hypothetical protein
MKNKRIGAGDLAHWLFRPAVYLVDLVWGTDLRDCDRCKERRAKWNTKLSMPLWVFVLVVTMLAVLLVWRRGK